MRKQRFTFFLNLYVLLLVSFIQVSLVQGQETYFSLQANYRGFVSAEGARREFLPEASLLFKNYAKSRAFTLKGDLYHRINGNYGIGVQMHYVVSQKSSFRFYSKQLFSSSFLYDSYDWMTNLRNPESRYYAQVYDYQLNILNSFTIYGSFITSAPINLYFDYRLSHYRLSESFDLYREYVPASFSGHHEIPEIFIQDDITHSKFAPGFAIGAKPHITEKLYLDIHLSWDFVVFQEHAFGHWVPFRSKDGYHEYGYIKSPLRGTKRIFNFGFGIGYIFK